MQQVHSLPLESDSMLQFSNGTHANVTETQVRRQRPVERICLFGLFGMDNYGNDGSLEAMLLFLRDTWPDATLSCVCINPEKVENDHNVPSVPIRWHGLSNSTLRLLDKFALTLPQKFANWVQAIRHLRKFDVLIVPGTSTLCDYRANPFGAPYALFRWAVAARMCGTKLFFVSTGAGPIHRRLSRWMLTYAARSACYRSFRDENSKDFLASLGIDTRQDEVYPDLAFKLLPPTPPMIRPSELYPVTIAVGLMDYNGWHGHARPDNTIYDIYLMKMTRFVRSILDRGYRVRLLVGEIADQRAVAALQIALAAYEYEFSLPAIPDASSSQLVVEPVRCLDDIMRQLADTSIVVASRFHNVVCALKLARPTISVGYQAKNDALMAQFGLEGFCHHIEHFDGDQLMQQVEDQIARLSLYEDMINRKLLEFQTRITQQEKVLAGIL
jgi:polysaccharide pyruvyl transferase WcaK-like protein